jgi:excisionase family DNA binding protein
VACLASRTTTPAHVHRDDSRGTNPDARRRRDRALYAAGGRRVTVTLDDDDARALANLVARVLIGEARDHGARATSQAMRLLQRLMHPEPGARPAALAETLSAVEAAQRMGCTTTYVRRLAAAGRIDAQKVGPVWAIRWPPTIAAPQPETPGACTLPA